MGIKNLDVAVDWLVIVELDVVTSRAMLLGTEQFSRLSKFVTLSADCYVSIVQG
jgi:hypothetical protein